eukprot:CAMPEP_0115045046 /NCGR_PEP_ID=MMETSP0216-20121206/47896_1 /TAXON_ID=223996 /ORGANISM="Protocruzia adherens, Strain Boccale" /LENGTH=34 /DNA_ID= /DNA_START= /DNA_END= /DNA_ORIENTATION=
MTIKITAREKMANKRNELAIGLGHGEHMFLAVCE